MLVIQESTEYFIERLLYFQDKVFFLSDFLLFFQKFVISPDGELLLFFGSKSLIHIFDTKTLSHIDTLQASEEVMSATFNSSGSRMYTHGSQFLERVILWEKVWLAEVLLLYEVEQNAGDLLFFSIFIFPFLICTSFLFNNIYYPFQMEVMFQSGTLTVECAYRSFMTMVAQMEHLQPSLQTTNTQLVALHQAL